MPKENLIPKIEEVREIDNKYETPSFEEFMKTYEEDEKVSESYKNEVNSVNVWASKGSGPCSYWGCSQPSSVPFIVEIYIEGCKWWARNPNKGTDLPGTWTWSPTSSYLWRNDLWLTHIGHARDADRLIGENNLYTVNTVGAYAWEDCEFCRGTQNLIRECISLHERGYGIEENRTLPSSTTRWTKWGIKATTGIALAFTPLSPVSTIIAGASTWGASKAIQVGCSSDKARHAWGMASDVGSEAIKGGAIGLAVQGVGAVLGAGEVAGLGSGAASSATSKAAGEYFIVDGVKIFANAEKARVVAAATHGVKVAGDIEKAVSFLKDAGFATWQAKEHTEHVSAGYDYKSWCSVCNA